MNLEKKDPGIKKFDGTEYDVWSALMEMYLTTHNLWYVIVQPKPEAPVNEQWNKDNSQARWSIMRSLESEMVKLILSCETAKDAWDRLKAVHAQKSEACRMVLYQEFYGTNLEPGQKISDYLAKIEFTAKKLKNSGASLDDETVISKVVTGLSQDYRHFMTSWMGTAKSERTFDNLLARLLAEESIIRPPEPSREMVAMRMNADRPRRDVECWYCSIKGHVKRHCRKYKKDLEDGTVKEASINKDQSAKKYVTVAEARPEEPGPPERQATVAQREPEGRASLFRFAIMANGGSAVGAGKWLIDSGASNHMTLNRDWLDNYKELNKHYPIRVGNCEYVYAVGEGSVTVVSTVNDRKHEVTINGVLYVPGISDNLFSIGAADDKGVTTRAIEGRMDIIKDGIVIMVGRKKKGSNMYTLDVETPIRACVARRERTAEEWHRVLGHPGMAEIRNLERKDCTLGFKVVEQPKMDSSCAHCPMGKASQVSHPSSTRERSTVALERVHVDLVGPVTPPSLSGKRHFLLARDEFSTYMNVYFLASKSEVCDLMQKYINEVSVQTQSKVRVIRSDNGSEFKNVAMSLLCQQEGITQEFSSPYTAEQNGEIERANRTIIESARAMLQASGLPLEFWGEAVSTAAYLKNRLPNKRTTHATPFELFHGRMPDYSHLMEFGQQVHVLDKSSYRSKFETKTLEAVVVGYGDRVNTYRCYLDAKKDVIISSDVFMAPHSSNRQLEHNGCGSFIIDGPIMCDEPPRNSSAPSDQPDANGHDSLSPPNQVVAELVSRPGPHSPSSNSGCEQGERDIVVEELVPERATHDQQEAPEEVRSPRRAQVQADSLSSSEGAAQSNPSCRAASRAHTSGPAQPPTCGRSIELRSRTVPAQVNSMAPSARTNVTLHSPQQPVVLRPAAGLARQIGASTTHQVAERLRSALCTRLPQTKANDSTKRNLSAVIEVEPRTFGEALSGANQNKWRAAIAEELAAHADNHTWELVQREAHMRELTAKWIFKIKDDDCGHKRYKARLVARGFDQQEGTDFNEIFAPVVRMDSIRLLFSLAVQLRLKYKQFDVTTAFLNGDLTEEIFLEPPEGLDVDSSLTCLLKRSLYGLKQAPRCWHAKFARSMQAIGMRPTASDPCVYVTDDGPTVYLALYVDDGLVFAREEETIDRLLLYLKEQFKIKEVNSSCFLGMQIKETERGIFLHQSRYIQRTLDKYNMTECKSKPTPIEAGHALNRHETLETPVVDSVPYAELVGSLMYCSVATRPDISYPLSVLSKYTSKPREAHWQGLKRVVRYLSSTRFHGLLFERVEEPRLLCYTDADFAGDHETRRSTSGMVTFLASGPISYKAQQQSTVALSTTEAEYIAAAIAVKELVWLRRFLDELKIDLHKQPELLCDNQSALRLIRNPEFHQRSKHIDVAYHFIREKFEEGLFMTKYVSSEEQLADLFTKAFTTTRFQELRGAVGCVQPEE